MGFASKTTENTDFLFSKKESNQKIERKQRNLPKIMLGTGRKFKEWCHIFIRGKKNTLPYLLNLSHRILGWVVILSLVNN